MSDPEKLDGVPEPAAAAGGDRPVPEPADNAEDNADSESKEVAAPAGDDRPNSPDSAAADNEAPAPETPRAEDPAAPEENSPAAENAEEQKAKPLARSADPAAEPAPVHTDKQRPADPESADDVLTRRMAGKEAADAAVLARSRRHTRRSFLVTAAGLAAGVGLYEWFNRGPQDDMQPVLLRDAYNLNARLSHTLFRERALSPTYPLSRAETLRVNGMFGLKMALVPESWRLQLVGMRGAAQHARYSQDVTAWEYRYTSAVSSEDKGHDTKVDPSIASSAKMAPAPMVQQAEEDENHTGRKPRGSEEAGESDSTLPPHTPGLLLTMQDILKLPRHELVTQFKCIEGWSQVVHWAGVRMADFLEAYPPEPIDGKQPRYVYMETPDGDYYTGYDLEGLHHPQALLVTEMMGAPLTQFHGAPLRLHMPTKYGYKQIKRIGLIAYTNDKPDDYWTKLGYDWYAGL